MRKLLSIILLLFGTVCYASEITKVRSPIEVVRELKDPDFPIDHLEWNRWTSENFEVLCLNNSHAIFLHEHLELVKKWIYSRWGLYDIVFPSKCRVICVDDPALFQKMFRISSSMADLRSDMNVLFILASDKPSRVIPVPLSMICISEFGKRYDCNFGWWAYRGISQLNGPVDEIKETAIEIGDLIKADKPMFFSESLLKLTEDQYYAETLENRNMFDRNALLFCLFLRKEFGQERFHWVLRKSCDNPEGALKTVLGFENYSHFDRSFKKYMEKLSDDCKKSLTPNSYFIIKD